MVSFVSRIPGLAITIGRATVRFHKNLFTTDDMDLVKEMRKHVACGKKYKEIKSKEEYQRVVRYGNDQYQRYVRGPASTAMPGRTQVVTDPAHTVAADDTPVEEIAKGKRPKEAVTKVVKPAGNDVPGTPRIGEN